MSFDEDRGGRVFCDLCNCRWRQDGDELLPLIALTEGLNCSGPGQINQVAVFDRQATIHICRWCHDALKKLPLAEKPIEMADTVEYEDAC